MRPQNSWVPIRQRAPFDSIQRFGLLHCPQRASVPNLNLDPLRDCDPPTALPNAQPRDRFERELRAREAVHRHHPLHFLRRRLARKRPDEVVSKTASDGLKIGVPLRVHFLENPTCVFRNARTKTLFAPPPNRPCAYVLDFQRQQQ